MLLLDLLVGCSVQEQQVHDPSYLTISQVLPYLDLSSLQVFPSRIEDILYSPVLSCTQNNEIKEPVNSKEQQPQKHLSFHDECFYNITTTKTKESKPLREEQSFAHPFRENREFTLSFPYSKNPKSISFDGSIDKNLRIEGKIELSPTEINGEGFSIFQQNEDNTETLILYIDGLISTIPKSTTIDHIDISGFFCGIFSSCNGKPWQIDLRHQIHYDNTDISQVTIGSITQHRSISIEGSFLYQENQCDMRPISGHIGIEKGSRYDMTFEETCDHCAYVSTQGKPSIQICNDMP